MATTAPSEPYGENKLCAGCGLATSFILSENNQQYPAWHGECLAYARALGGAS
jgi:hypothetical protein